MRVITIGRSTGNNVVINDTLVSKSHCQIIQDSNGNYRLIDNNSTNGTYINGERRHGEVRLNQSDIIRIGNTTLPWQAYFKGGTEIGSGRVDVVEINYPTPELLKSGVFGILALIFGIIGGSILAIIFGIIGMQSDRQHRGLAVAGLVLGCFWTVVYIILWIVIASTTSYVPYYY